MTKSLLPLHPILLFAAFQSAYFWIAAIFIFLLSTILPMAGLIGKKIGMTRVYDAKGDCLPCTIIQTGPCYVTQLKTEEKDGYNSVQIGYLEQKEQRVTKSILGHFKKAGTPALKKMVEFRDFLLPSKKKVQIGDIITLSDIFVEGERVHVTGVSKGKGFQGTRKRHNFSGVGERSHGQGAVEHAPGSIGAGSTPSKVWKGMRMAGQTGGRRSHVKGLLVLKKIPEQNVIIIKGAVPGPNKGYVILTK